MHRHLDKKRRFLYNERAVVVDIYTIKKGGGRVAVLDTNDVKNAKAAFRATRYRDIATPPHLHYSVEILCVKEGRIAVTVGDDTRQLAAGESTLLLPFEPHSITSEEGSDCFSVSFSPELIPDFYENIKDRSPRPAVCTLSADVFAMCDHHLPVGVVHTMQAKAILYPLCEEFRRHCTFEKPAKTHRKNVFTDALRYVAKNIPAADLSLSTTAQALGVNPAYLSRVFRQSSSIHFTKYVNMLRCFYAARILHEHPDRTVTEVALEAGFGSVRSFNREFQDLYGVAPHCLVQDV